MADVDYELRIDGSRIDVSRIERGYGCELGFTRRGKALQLYRSF